MKPTKAGMKKYLDIAAMLKPMLAGFEGLSGRAFFQSQRRGQTVVYERVDR